MNITMYEPPETPKGPEPESNGISLELERIEACKDFLKRKINPYTAKNLSLDMLWTSLWDFVDARELRQMYPIAGPLLLKTLFSDALKAYINAEDTTL